MKQLLFSTVYNYRTYGIELRERTYPKFEGKYNAYVMVFGQLSGDYLGSIEQPLKMDITEDEIFNLIPEAEQLVKAGHKVSIW